MVWQGGLLDSEAAARCTTVYLVDRRLDMLPGGCWSGACFQVGAVLEHVVRWVLGQQALCHRLPGGPAAGHAAGWVLWWGSLP